MNYLELIKFCNFIYMCLLVMIDSGIKLKDSISAIPLVFLMILCIITNLT